MRIGVRLVVLLVAAAVLAACGGAAGGDKAALVNGKPILMADYNKQVKIVQDSLVGQGLDPKSVDGKETLDQMRSDLLEQMIDIELMRQAAEKEGIAVTEADVNARLEQIRKDAGGAEAFKESLKEAKLTEQEFRTYVVRDQIIYERLYDKVVAAMPATAEQVRVRHILLATEKEATDTQARLAKGEDFAALAKALSIDTQSKESGGELGFFPRGVLDQAFEDLIFRLKVNEIGVVKTDYGAHVVQVLAKEATRQLAPEIRQILGEERINTYMENLRTNATIERLVKLPPTPTPSQ
jgi:parvulin-like peptidyl-prolyl isomerase